MKKHFNTTGPCHPGEHYMLPAQARCEGLAGLIAQKHYFVIHAAHETGKTTLLLDLVRELNGSGDYHALYCSLGTVEGIDDPERGIPAVVRSLKLEVEFNEALEKYVFAEKADYSDFNNVLVKSLSCFCKKLDRPLVILFNDMDCLSYETRNSFLLQLRDGFVNRDQIPFVHSIGLVGMRNIRDYKFQVRDEHQSFSSASPLDIVSETFKLRDFTRDEITQLYEQHTEQSGQVFSEEAVRRIYHHTGGQPWLVNALACEILEKILGSDSSEKISPEHAEQAAENIISQRNTHIDSLLRLLRNKRVQKIVEPVITGGRGNYDPLNDDYQFILDIGLLCESSQGLAPSNPIYAEAIIRYLSFSSQRQIDGHDYPPKAYLKGDRLDMKKLLRDFQSFWRRNSEIWTEAYQYKEAAPHLILQAFIQRIIGRGGRISRELAAGRGMAHLCVHYRNASYPIELKLGYGDATYEEGKTQLARYMKRLGCDEGWLIVFDRRKTPSWDEKIFWKTATVEGRTLNIVGC